MYGKNQLNKKKMMKNSEDLIGIATVHKLCPICCKKVEGSEEILMNSVLTKKNADAIREMNNKAIAWSDKPCPECQKVIDENVLFIIGIVPEKTEDFHNPYRSGHIVGIKRNSEFVKNMPEKFKTKDAILMDVKEMRSLGMIEYNNQIITDVITEE